MAKHRKGRIGRMQLDVLSGTYREFPDIVPAPKEKMHTGYCYCNCKFKPSDKCACNLCGAGWHNPTANGTGTRAKRLRNNHYLFKMTEKKFREQLAQHLHIEASVAAIDEMETGTDLEDPFGAEENMPTTEELVNRGLKTVQPLLSREQAELVERLRQDISMGQLTYRNRIEQDMYAVSGQRPRPGEMITEIVPGEGFNWHRDRYIAALDEQKRLMELTEKQSEPKGIDLSKPRKINLG